MLDTRAYGNGAPRFWIDLFEFLGALAVAGVAYAGVRQAGADIAAAAKRLESAFRKCYRWLIGRGASDPSTPLRTILSKQAWRLSTLAVHLNLSEDDTRVLLEALGYEVAAGDLYSRGQSLDPATLREAIISEFLWRDPLEPPE